MPEASCSLDFDFDIPHLRNERGDRRREVQLERVSQVIQCFLFRRALTGNIDLDALGDVPLAFLPDASCEGLFHILTPPSGTTIVSLSLAQRALSSQQATSVAARVSVF